MRAFIALIPPEEVIEQLTTFLEPRRDALAGHGQWRWTRPEHLHLTLAFLPELEEWREEQLLEDGAEWAGRSSPMPLQLRGAGAFPDPGSARVLWAAVVESDGHDHRQATGDTVGPHHDHHSATGDTGGPHHDHPQATGDTVGAAHDHRQATGDTVGPLSAWAKALRALASHAGARVDGTRFSPHVTLARAAGGRHPAGHLVQALDTLATPTWTADEVHLVRSHLGQGPAGTPRYEVRHTWELGQAPAVSPITP